VLYITCGVLKISLKFSSQTKHGLRLENTLEFRLLDKRIKSRTKPAFEKRYLKREGICFGLVFQVHRRAQL
jgi:hypothetical protein